MDRVDMGGKVASKVHLAELAFSASFPNAALAFPVSGEEGAEFWMVGEEMFQEGLLQPSEAADAAAVVEQLRVHPFITVLLDCVVPHDVHLLGVHAAHGALVANVEMVHLNVNSQSVLVGGSESANSARPPLKKRVKSYKNSANSSSSGRPPLILVSLHLHLCWKLSLGLFDDLDILVDRVKEKV